MKCSTKMVASDLIYLAIFKKSTRANLADFSMGTESYGDSNKGNDDNYCRRPTILKLPGNQ